MSRLLGAGLLAAAVLAAGLGMDARLAGSSAAGPERPPPNVVVIVTDDQRAESLRVMTNVRRLLGRGGATFERSYVNFALCCPSRATFLTGQYSHNHGVLGNTPPEGGFGVFDRLHGTDNLVTWLRDGGYRTALVGKYFNGYGDEDPRSVPAGWDEWVASTPPGQRVYDYTLNDNGTLVHYGNQPEDFKEDVLSDTAVDVISRRTPSDRPLFLTVAYTAPHVGGPTPSPQPPRDCGGTAKPAPRHAHAFDSAPLPTPPNFNEGNVSDKPPSVANLPPINAAARRGLERRYRCYLESLLAVDDGVGRIVRELRRAGELDETLVIFTSDNGLFFGEHRIPAGKVRHYDASSRVPLVIRGPGIRRGSRIAEPVINADLTPTILEAAGVDVDASLDGRSLLPLTANDADPLARDLLLESRTFVALRSSRFVYVDHVGGAARGFEELYDLRSDPHQLRNLAGRRGMGAVQTRLRERLETLSDCAGASCSSSSPRAPRR